MANNDQHKRITEITDPLLRMAQSKGSDNALLDFSLDQVLKNAGQRQAEVLRRCAVVRWFDANVIAVLRDNKEGNEHVLDLLRSYSFVRDIGDGRLAYHDQVRRTLLDKWRTERPDDLRDIHLRLYKYFSERTTPSGAALAPTSGSNILRAVPLSENRELWRREALYHLLSANPEAGMTELRASFEDLEAVHRLADAESLLQVAGELPLGRREQHWLHYFQARVQEASMRLDLAAEQLQNLLAQPDLDPELTAQAQRSLGEVWTENGQWARATDLYRKSLSYFQQQNDQRAVADTMMMLGEAYQGLGINTGSWHVSQLATHPVLRLLSAVWDGLLGLPFLIIGFFLRNTPHYLPVPRYCARYQNWLLIRLYNTARDCYVQARDGYRALANEEGLLRAEQRLADIQLLFGYPREAMHQINAMLERPVARDPYRRAWLHRSLAECHLKMGDVGSTQVLFANALEVFRDLGDIRREATVLALQGRAAALAGNAEGALASYRSSLNQFRALRYTAAREKILHGLRIWRRNLGPASNVGRQVTALINAEPEKRYVGRFISSLLRLLQLASLMALPLSLLLLAYFVPTQVVETLAGGTLSVRTFYDPLRALGVLAILVPLYLASYTLMSLTVIFFLPISRIEERQPDMITTTPQGIARYDSKGNLVSHMPWANVRAWISLDRCIWERPLPLYSRTFLEDTSGNDLRIDGITGWYGDLQNDIAQRFTELKLQVKRIDLGYRLLRSKSGAAAVIGGLLLLIFTSSVNGWVPLLSFMPPTLYVLLQMLTFSGALLLVPMAYWLANRPLKLQRALELNDYWPIVVAILGALPVITYVVSGGQALPVRMLNVGTFVWGIYMLAEALVALTIPTRKQLRLAIVVSTLLIGLLVAAVPTYTIYNEMLSDVTAYRANRVIASAASGEPRPAGAVVEAQNAALESYDAAIRAQQTGSDAYSSYMRQGETARLAGQYQVAIESYSQAMAVAPDPASQARALYNRSLVHLEQGDRAQFDQDWGAAKTICADPSLDSDAICRQINERRITDVTNLLN